MKTKKYDAIIERYNDPFNPYDSGNNCYYIFVGLHSIDTNKDNFFNEEISKECNIDFLALSKKYGGFMSKFDIFFHYKYQADDCRRELLRMINQ